MKTNRKFEAFGFLLIIAGMFLCAQSPEAGGPLIIFGFVIFLIGRFL